MRTVLAATLALALAVAVTAPHLHADGHGGGDCAVCVVRGGEVATTQTPDLSPADLPAGEAPAAPPRPPVCGAPLGAIPGQSPPRA
ncbi:MAG: hypothetical protein NDI82_03480 [Anaeromyxobacteraceae bacterium]|nr:hypothetical protein [Anaeromyxobacteraceae bacterium]